MDIELVKKLIKLTEDSDISGLSVEEGGLKIEVKREKTVVAHASPVPHAPAAHHAPVAHAAKAEVDEDAGFLAIIAPMVGTFYKTPSPDSPPYVSVGDRVESGKVVCIIEAMKLFNEIESEVKGKIVKILVENGQPVEYGQKLFLIKKD